MTLEKEGYLSPELDWTRKVREGFPTYTRLTKEMSDLCQFVIFEMSRTLRKSDPRSGLAIAGTIRLAEFLQAAIILIERGTITAARTSLRAGFETAFFLGGLAEIPDFVRLANNEDVVQSLKMHKAQLRMQAKYEIDPAQRDRNIAILNKMIEEDHARVRLSEGEKLKGWNWQEIAEKAGLGDAYETYYRLLSTDAAHAVFYALEHLFDSDGSIKYGPGTRDYLDTFFFVMALGDTGLSQSNALLKSDEVHRRLLSLYQQTMEFELKRQAKTTE